MTYAYFLEIRESNHSSNRYFDFFFQKVANRIVSKSLQPVSPSPKVWKFVAKFKSSFQNSQAGL